MIERPAMAQEMLSTPPRTSPSTSLSTGPGLLSIDVDSEVKKLCARQLASTADQVAELARTLIAHGAIEIRITIHRRRTILVAPGAVVPAPLLATLRLIRDPSAEDQQRHRALVACEQNNGLGILALLSEPQLMLVSGNQELHISPDGVRIQRQRSACGTTITLRRPPGPADVAVLVRTCRFAEIPILIGGRRISRGLALSNVLLPRRFDFGAGVGVIGLPRQGDLCRTAYVRHGIVGKETIGVSPSGEAHVVVIRMDQEEVDSEGLAAAVRRARAALYQRLREAYPHLPPGDRVAARNLLFKHYAAQRQDGRDLLSGLAIFCRLEGGAVDLITLSKMAAAGVIWAIDRDRGWRQGRQPFLLDKKQIFVLDEKERAFISDQLEVVIAEPPVRAKECRLLRLWTSAYRGLRRLRQELTKAVARLRAIRLLAETELSAAERRLLAGIRAELNSGRFLLPGVAVELSRTTEVAITPRGVLPPRLVDHGGQRVICLPRPQLRPMVAAYTTAPELLYPIMVGLWHGFDGFGARKASLQEALLSVALPREI